MTAGFLSSGGSTVFQAALKEQRKQTQQAFSKYYDFLKTFSTNESSIKEQLSVIQNYLNGLDNIRRKIDAQDIKTAQAISFYTTMNKESLALVASLPKFSSNVVVSNELASYANFLLAKERAGIERAVLSGVFAKDQFNKANYKKFIELVNAQDTYISSFMIIAPQRFKDAYKAKVSSDAFKDVQKYREIAFEKADTGMFGVNAKIWFDTITKKINLLKDVENDISSELLNGIDDLLSKSENSLFFSALIAMVNLLVEIILALVTFTSVVSSMEKVRRGLYGFMRYINREQDHIELIELHTNDEFGQMAQEMNNSLKAISEGVEQDKKAVNDMLDVARKVSDGFFIYKIKEKAANIELQNTIDTFNDMVENVKKSIYTAKDCLVEYARGNYNYSVQDVNIRGNLGSFISTLSALGQVNTDIFAIMNKYAFDLKNGAENMTKLSEELSSASNEQATSLEETSASMEEMTANISSSVEKIAQVQSMASDANEAAKEGIGLASKTSSAMEDIVKATDKINDTIAMIENIAFQTNILSLNAAVEAATAGEAGKGFAVVAQEVRNLATRSAEAVKEIKSSVDEAQNSARGGREIVTQMVESFDMIADKITSTTENVSHVANASKEQMAGVQQINDAIAGLDKVTQDNSRGASQIHYMSSEFLDMANQIELILSKFEYNKSAEKRACDVDMIFHMNKLKMDHVVFKERYYDETAKADKKFKVVDNHSCALGKWIDANKNESFAKTSNWKKLIDVHAHVHEGVQSFCDANIDKISFEKISTTAKDIEADTLKVFEALDTVKLDNCLSNN